MSGPVPWSVKRPVLETLALDDTWHPAIWRAVQVSVADVFGRVAPQPALRLLATLAPPPADVDAAELRRQLAGTT